MKVVPGGPEETKTKDPKIKAKASVLDKKNKRLRVLQAQARVIEVQNGLKDTVCAQIFGERDVVFNKSSSPRRRWGRVFFE
jgi:hypothetical protein